VDHRIKNVTIGKKMANLLSVREAQEHIINSLQPVGVETISIEQAAGRVLAEDITAPGDLPPFANSSMDGFAVKAADIAAASPGTPVMLDIIGDIQAGAVLNITVQQGQAARIMTGAPLPEGAEAVIPVEETSFAPGQAKGEGAQPMAMQPRQVAIFRSTHPGANIRPRGSDVTAGQELLKTGRLIQPQDIGIIASIGRPQVSVYRKPRIALFSSGDELVPPGQPLGWGKIYDSNQYVLAAMLERAGAEVIRLGTSPDDPHQIAAHLSRAVDQRADMIVTSAGVSVGAFDFVRQVIETQGSLNFWKVNMRPGKPLAYGSFAGIPLVGLPGNPVSAFVGCLVFVLPALARLAGRDWDKPGYTKAFLTEDVESDGRESYLRVVVRSQDGKPVVTLTGHQGSGNLFSLVQANALLILPSGVKSLPSGSEVNIWYLDRSNER
jgi:molybdopterin molybdotransferase